MVSWRRVSISETVLIDINLALLLIFTTHSNQMKKIIAVLIAGACASAGAYAADGTITITGALTAQTCTINGNAAGTQTAINVTLPTLSTTGLAVAGDTSGSTPFSIHLTDCDATSALTFFEAGPTIDLATGNLINQAPAGADLVQVGLLNDKFAAINLVTNANSQQVAIVNEAADLNYYAQYVATGASTAGAVNTSVRFSMQYN
jgi:major type 1 subunit fimbrin (pilin)